MCVMCVPHLYLHTVRDTLQLNPSDHEQQCSVGGTPLSPLPPSLIAGGRLQNSPSGEGEEEEPNEAPPPEAALTSDRYVVRDWEWIDSETVYKGVHQWAVGMAGVWCLYFAASCPPNYP